MVYRKELPIQLLQLIFLGLIQLLQLLKIFPDFACCSKARPLSDTIVQTRVLLALGDCRIADCSGSRIGAPEVNAPFV